MVVNKTQSVGITGIQIENLDDALDYIPRYLKVLTKADEHGNSQLIPMGLWKSQEHYLRNRTHRDIIIKNRQHGISTGIMAVNAQFRETLARLLNRRIRHLCTTYKMQNG